jgi:hypothetical protein
MFLSLTLFLYHLLSLSLSLSQLQDIYDQNYNLIMGMLWRLMLSFHVHEAMKEVDAVSPDVPPSTSSSSSTPSSSSSQGSEAPTMDSEEVSFFHLFSEKDYFLLNSSLHQGTKYSFQKVVEDYVAFVNRRLLLIPTRCRPNPVFNLTTSFTDGAALLGTVSFRFLSL